MFRAEMSPRATDAAALAAVIVIALLVSWPIFEIRPLISDNLYPLAWVEASPASALLKGDPYYYPEWRPLAYASLWVEHRVVPLPWVGVHHAVNLATWIISAVLISRLVLAYSGSRAAGWLSALLFVTDPRAVSALTQIVERQNTLALLCGLGGWLLAVRAAAPIRGWRAAALAALLLASGLSKIYGLAFAVGLGAAAIYDRRFDVVRAAAGAVATYAAMRLWFAGGAIGVYCSRTYVFFDERQLCVADVSRANVAQMAYNAAATTINLLISGAFSDVGEPTLAIRRLLIAAVVLAATALALTHARPPLRAALFIIAVSGLMGFPVYHERNQLVGASAVMVMSGIGIAIAFSAAGGARRYVLASAIVAALALQITNTARIVDDYAADANHNDPCETQLYQERPWARPFVVRVKQHYGLEDPFCEGRH